jgi:uncharacterized protein YciI
LSNDDFPPGVTVEKVYLVEATYTPEAAERRPAVRSEHLAGIAAQKLAGVFIEAGAYADGLTSSLMLINAKDEASALAIARQDVYVASGVWGEISVRPFGRVVPTSS